jgi:dynein heavy chain, axonemal
LEDINNLLNSGEIPNLFGKDEIDEITNDLGNEARLLKYNNTMKLFNDRVRDLFHVVLAMSPVGNLLRPRMRMFPSIVNCTTLDCKIKFKKI